MYARRLSTARRKDPLGMTLIELLVVITILTIITVATLPLMQPPSADRKVREAAREFSATLEQARAQAISTGRPAGVLIELGQNNTAQTASESSRIFLCEVPLPYSGDTTSATVNVDPMNPNTIIFNNPAANFGYLSTLCKYGDKVRFNSRGPYYTISGGTIGANISGSSCQITAPQGYSLPIGGLLNAQIQIFRQPVKSSTPPTVLAGNAPQPIIDLSQSGVGQNMRFEYASDTATSLSTRLANSTNVMLTFQPSGQVERLAYSNGTNQTSVMPTSTVFFLVRLRLEEGAMPYGTVDKAFRDPTAYWVAVNPFTGSITVADVASTGGTLTQSREDAIKNQTTGTF